MKWFKLGDLLQSTGPIGSFGALYTVVYANGLRKNKELNDFTELELNTTVLNIFAVGKEHYQIHLIKLGEVLK